MNTQYIISTMIYSVAVSSWKDGFEEKSLNNSENIFSSNNGCEILFLR